MITVLTGENSFEIAREVERIETEFVGSTEKIDGEDLTVERLPDVLMGVTLFSEKRLIVIRNLSDNKVLWTDFSDWIKRLSDDIDLVLVEPKPDKRTKTFKELQKNASFREYKVWTERDRAQAEVWTIDEAKRQGLSLDKKHARLLVERTSVDQWTIYHAIEKLTVLDTIDQKVIEDVIEAHPQESVFQLFETALDGDRARVTEMIRTLEQTEDPYRLFGLLAGQAFQLAVLAHSTTSSANVAKEFGVHPFVLGKLSSHAKQRGKLGVRRVVEVFAEADAALKSISTDPWLLIERALLKVTKE